MKYKKVKIGKKEVLIHRLVVENKINRVLKDSEKIHHINGVKDDNRINNLMLFPSQKEHKKFENKVRQFGLTNPVKKQIRERWDNLE